jgi:hypothetical protein
MSGMTMLNVCVISYIMTMAVRLARVVAAYTAAMPTSAYAAALPVHAGKSVWTTAPNTPPSVAPMKKLGENELRLHVEGQYDERGHNRQASWYYFRLDQVRGRDLTLTLTDFEGEYNDKPGAVPMNADTIPVFSADGRTAYFI